MGLRSRRKGKSFELVIRDHIQDAFKHLGSLTVRRSSQAERAYESDLIIEGPDIPQCLLDLWVECEHANKPNPAKKYEQALRDAALYMKRMKRVRVPIVCWRATGERTIWLSTTLANMNALCGLSAHDSDLLVTARLADVLTILAVRV